jgi:hypothetical protein
VLAVSAVSVASGGQDVVAFPLAAKHLPHLSFLGSKKSVRKI